MSIALRARRQIDVYIDGDYLVICEQDSLGENQYVYIPIEDVDAFVGAIVDEVAKNQDGNEE